jgi:putative ATP-binding cassette transporter
MRLLFLLRKTSWMSFIGAIVTGLLSGISSTGLIALINFAIAQNASANSLWAISFIGLCGLLLVSMAISQRLLARLVHTVTLKLRIQLTHQILACPLRHLEELGVAKLLATLTEDVEAISNASFLIANLCIAVAMLIACTFYLLWLSLPIFALALTFAIISISSYNQFLNHGKSFFKLARFEQDQLFAHFRTAIDGVKELKLHAARRQEFLLEDLERSATTVKQYQDSATDIMAIASGWGFLLLFIPLGLLILVVPNFVNLPTSVFSGYALTLVFLLTPMRIILNTLPELSRASIALGKIESIGLSLAALNPETDNTLPNSQVCTDINLELVSVTHKYGNDQDTSQFQVGPIDLSFSPGELVFIVGGNGSGKSTLVKLITGLYTPESGIIRANDKVITDKNRDWYRQQFSVVFYDFYLFERLLGLNHPDLETQATEYLTKLQLNRKVQITDGKFSTTALSQGQRKRLALLTAYLEDRPVYVFDEWASDQDPTFKDIFYTQLLSALKHRGKIVIAISHDDHYFHVADRIIKLDYGQLEYDKRLQ